MGDIDQRLTNLPVGRLWVSTAVFPIVVLYVLHMLALTAKVSFGHIQRADTTRVVGLRQKRDLRLCAGKIRLISKQVR